MGEVLEFLRLIWAVDHELQASSKRMEAVLGVTGPQRLVIRIVSRFPGISAGQLSAILHVHPSTLTGILRRLERRGHVVRRADPRDGRRALLGLTPKGRELDMLPVDTVEAAVRRALAGLPPVKIRAAEEVLARLANSLRAGDSPGNLTRGAGKRGSRRRAG